MRSLRAAVWLLVTLAMAPAPAALAQGDEARGRELLGAFEDGARGCAETSGAEFEAVGEYLMARMAGGAGPHRDMDDLMGSMMGARGERAAHGQMGRRAAGCGGGPLGGMMGMMMGAGGAIAPGYVAGGDSGRLELSGADDDWHGEDTAMVVLMAVLLMLVGGISWMLLRRGRGAPPDGTALEILARRFAAGEITEEDYDRRRQALGGAR